MPAGMSVLIGHFGARSLADGPASSAFIAAVAVAVLLGTVRRTGTSVGSLTTSPPLPSRIRKYARTIIVVAWRGRWRVHPTVGLGVVAGTSVTDDVGDGVGAAEGDAEGKAVVDRTLAVGVPATPSLGLAPGALQAAKRRSPPEVRRSAHGGTWLLPPIRDSSTLSIDSSHPRDICRRS